MPILQWVDILSFNGAGSSRLSRKRSHKMVAVVVFYLKLMCTIRTCYTAFGIFYITIKSINEWRAWRSYDEQFGDHRQRRVSVCSAAVSVAGVNTASWNWGSGAEGSTRWRPAATKVTRAESVTVSGGQLVLDLHQPTVSNAHAACIGLPAHVTSAIKTTDPATRPPGCAHSNSSSGRIGPY